MFRVAPELKMSIFTVQLEIVGSECGVGEQADTQQMKLASERVSELCGVTTPGPVTLHQLSVLK